MSRRDEIIDAAIQPLIDEHDLVPPDWAGQVCFDAAINEVRKHIEKDQVYSAALNIHILSSSALIEFLNSLTEKK